LIHDKKNIRPQNILILGPAHPLRGGLAAFNERLALQFQAEGHRVHIVTFSLQYPTFLFPGKTQYSDAPAPTDLSIEVSLNAINPFSWVRVAWRMAQWRPHLVVCRFWLPFMAPSLGSVLRGMRFFSFFLRKKEKFRLVGLIDNIVPHEKRFGDRFLARYFTAACDSFVVMAESVRKEMKDFSAKECQLVPHPIYDTYGEKATRAEALSQLELDPAFRYVLFFGFIRHYKGLDLLLEAFANSAIQKSEKLPIKLLVAGEFYDDEAFYTTLIEQKSLKNQVVLHAQYIASDQVRYYFAAADLVVQPYRTATQSGISQIAYHFEKPMVVTNIGGLPEIVPDGEVGYVVEPTPETIAAAILDFFENNRADFFTQGVRQHKKRFSWENFSEAFFSNAV
jgi:D-inositol-3-phosphate glycosyltransferase